MGALLKTYVDAKLVESRNSWYYIGKDNLGHKKEAEVKLIKLIEGGKIEKLAIEPDSTSQPEINLGDGGPKEELLPLSQPDTKKINPALSKNEELPKNLEEIYKPLAADIGDIESRKKGGRFKVFVFGIDVRYADHDVIKKCPYVFRHCDKKHNVRSGHKVFNAGWTVVSKKLIVEDPRTGKKWLTVARDDTPDEDVYTVSNYVLCYADKGQYERKKGKMAMENILKTTLVADKRQEQAERMAALSKTNPAQSIAGYMSSNVSDQSVAKETLEKNLKFSANEAQEHIDNMNALGNKDTDIKSEVAKMQELVNTGKVGKTLKSAQSITIDEI